MKMKLILYTLFISIFLSSCLIIKESDTSDDELPLVRLSPKPELEMSDNLVRSEQGDMISFIPEGWFFVDLEQEASPEIFAVAVNPDYTLAAIFSDLRRTEQIEKAWSTEGLLGVARMSYDLKNKKSNGKSQLMHNIQTIEIGNLTFAKYEASTTGGALSAKVVVFKSELDFFYEMAIVPMDIIGKPLPPKDEIKKVFNSILATVKY